MRNYSDPTANAAIGAVDKEIKAKQKLAKRLKELYDEGRISNKRLAELSKQFTGIYRHIYFDVFEK